MTGAARVARSFTASGHVQGVGFRWFVREQAARRQLAGWVANRPDGSVQGEVWGEAAEIEAFLHAVRQGPPGASVSAFEVVALGERAEIPTRFEIRR